MFKKLLDKDYYFCLNWPVYLRPIWRLKIAEFGAVFICYIMMKAMYYNFIFFMIMLLFPLRIDVAIYIRHIRLYDSGNKIKSLWFRNDLILRTTKSLREKYSFLFKSSVFISKRKIYSDLTFLLPITVGIIHLILLIISDIVPEFVNVVNNLIDYHLFSVIDDRSEILVKLGKFSLVPRQRMVDHIAIYLIIFSILFSILYVDKKFYLNFKMHLKELIINSYSKRDFLICYLSVHFTIFMCFLFFTYMVFSISYSLNGTMDIRGYLFDAVRSNFALYFVTVITYFLFGFVLYSLKLISTIIRVAFYTKLPIVSRNVVEEVGQNLVSQQKEGDEV